MSKKEFYGNVIIRGYHGNVIIRGYLIGYSDGKFFTESLIDDSRKYFRTENEATEFAKSN
ncbi:MAG: hypothetical protein ACRC6O_13415 [Flavobacterium sp.]